MEDEVMGVKGEAMSILEERVTAGAALLDERVPGWAKTIRLGDLNMGSGSNCVLAQLFGDYNRGVDLFGLARGQERAYGFYGLQFGVLTRLWKEEVRARRSRPSIPTVRAAVAS